MAKQKKEAIRLRKATHRETQCALEEDQILALQTVQQEELRQLRAKLGSLNTGYELTEHQCEENRRRRATASTPEEKEQTRKAILAENKERYKKYCISILILLEMKQKSAYTNSSGTQNSAKLISAMKEYNEDPELGGVSGL